MFGLAMVLLASHRTRVSVVNGVIEAHGPAIAWVLTHVTVLGGGAAALTLGHLVLGRDLEALESTRVHERVHVRQYEQWGPLFVPAYLASSVWAVATGRHFYLDNWFERQAFWAEATSDL
ncbi:MAG: hypothetical protein FJW27_03970 [Acidimicrobiia bacterium]|nr:hypothetical protein [Acidimicrobiia bacterium]